MNSISSEAMNEFERSTTVLDIAIENLISIVETMYSLNRRDSLSRLNDALQNKIDVEEAASEITRKDPNKNLSQITLKQKAPFMNTSKLIFNDINSLRLRSDTIKSTPADITRFNTKNIEDITLGKRKANQDKNQGTVSENASLKSGVDREERNEFYIKEMNKWLDESNENQLKQLYLHDKEKLIITKEVKIIRLLKIMFPSASNVRYYNISNEKSSDFYLISNNFYNLCRRIYENITYSGEFASEGPYEDALLKEAKREYPNLKQNTSVFCGQGICGTPDAVELDQSNPTKVKYIGEFKYHKKLKETERDIDMKQAFLYKYLTGCYEAIYCTMNGKQEIEITKSIPINVNFASEQISNMKKNHIHFLKAAQRRGLKISSFLN